MLEILICPLFTPLAVEDEDPNRQQSQDQSHDYREDVRQYHGIGWVPIVSSYVEHCRNNYLEKTFHEETEYTAPIEEVVQLIAQFL